jgi:hypothetical protein
LEVARISNSADSLARVLPPAGENDVRDASDLADLLRMGRLPAAWIAPPATRELPSWSGTGTRWSRSVRAARTRFTRSWPSLAFTSR